MSTTPKGPKPEEAGTAGRPPRPALDQTFLGVAPALPVPAASPAHPGNPAKPAAPGGSAIIAAPMISVSGDRARGANPAPAPQVVTPAPAPAPRAPLQGGWQSATVMPRAPGNPEQTMLHGTPPAAWAPPAPAASPPPAPPARAELPRPIPPAVERSAPAYPVAAAVQHTALASDYLRGARDAALGASPARAPAPGGSPPAAPAPRFHEAPPAAPPAPALRLQEAPVSVPAPPTQPLSSEHPAPTPPVSVYPGALDARSAPSPVSSAPVAFQPAAPVLHGSEALHGPPSTGGGTQASVAPPRLDVSARVDAPAPARVDVPAPVRNAAPALGGMAPVPNAPRVAVPSPLAGTMLEPPRSLPAPAAAAPSSPPASFATRFEQVPSARSAFSQHGSGAALPIPIDQSAADWAQTSGNSTAGGANKAGSSSASQLRLILLAAVAILAIGFAAFGKQLLGGAPPQRTAHAPARLAPATPLEPEASPDQAMLANRPGANPSAALATATPGSTVSPPPAAALPASPPPESEVAAEETEEAAASPEDAPAGGNAQAEATATAESRLAAQGARHVIAGRYAEALPVYRELARAYSQNTAYTAMAHVLEQKLGLAPGAAPAPAQP